MTENYRTKYKKYKHKYINLKLTGGMVEPYDHTIKSEVNHYVGVITDVEPSIKPYLLILYGPPASGKTSAKNYIVDKLNLSTDYIYISEDRFAYDTKQFAELKSVDLTELRDISIDQFDNHPKVKFLEDSYNSIRKHTKFIMYPLIGSALMFKTNVVLEMTGVGIDWYMNTIIDEFYHYHYDIIIVYPFTSDTDFLYKRSVERGLKEHRFVPMKYFQIAVERSRENFRKILSDQHIKKFNKIYVFDAKTLNFLDPKSEPFILYESVNGDVINSDPYFQKLLT